MSIQRTDPEIKNLLAHWKNSEVPQLPPHEPSSRYSKISYVWDYSPVISTIVNIYKALSKCFHSSTGWDGTVLPAFKPLTRESEGFCRHLVLSVPGLGNFVVFVFDIYAKIKAKNILKNIPMGTSLSGTDVEALKQAAGYGSAEALVRLGQFYVWHRPQDMDRSTYCKLVGNLYSEAREQGNSEAQEWDSKWGSVFFTLLLMKEYQDCQNPQPVVYKEAFKKAILLAEQWSPEMQAKLPIFEEISSFCLKDPTTQKTTFLKKFCNKVDKSQTLDTSEVRTKIPANRRHR